MRVTISKTIHLEDVPTEIDDNFKAITDKFEVSRQALDSAIDNAREGRYVDSAETLENLRQLLVIIDKNIEEQQSLCLSYEKIRISKQMPESHSHSEPPQMEDLQDE